MLRLHNVCTGAVGERPQAVDKVEKENELRRKLVVSVSEIMRTPTHTEGFASSVVQVRCERSVML
eukprot:8964888-Pyramimonas_sp.AAC.2